MPQGRNGEDFDRRRWLWSCEYYPGTFVVVKRDGSRAFQAVRADALGGYIMTTGDFERLRGGGG